MFQSIFNTFIKKQESILNQKCESKPIQLQIKLELIAPKLITLKRAKATERINDSAPGLNLGGSKSNKLIILA